MVNSKKEDKNLYELCFHRLNTQYVITYRYKGVHFLAEIPCNLVELKSPVSLGNPLNCIKIIVIRHKKTTILIQWKTLEFRGFRFFFGSKYSVKIELKT